MIESLHNAADSTPASLKHRSFGCGDSLPALPMGPSSPMNLTHSSVYLTDKPYDVQLGVLKWIRGLLSEVIDKAATTATTAAAGAAIEPERDQRPHKGTDDRVRQEEIIISPSGKEGEENKVHRHEEREDVADTSGREEGTKILNSSPGCAAAAPASTAAGAAVGRKRPRAATLHGRPGFGVGSVVECFHPVSDVVLSLQRCAAMHVMRICAEMLQDGQRSNCRRVALTSLGLP